MAEAAAEAEKKVVTDQQVKERLAVLLTESDLSTTTEKKLRKQLEEEFGLSLSDRKQLIREQVVEFLNQHEGEEEEAADEAAEDEEEEAEDAGDGKKRRRGGGGFSKPCFLSEPLQAFVGAESMARSAVVKKLWEHIKANNLQDPKNKRNIILDEKLATLFTKPLNMFSMNKQLSKHIKTSADAVAGKAAAGSDEEEDEAGDSEQSEGSSDDSDERPRKSRNPAAKRAKKAGGSSGGGGWSNQRVKLSPQLAELVGVDTTSRPELTKFFWNYFKENQLFDPSNKQFVLADDKLKKLFNEDRFRAFGVSKYIKEHVTKI